MNTQPDPLQERQASGGGRSTPEGKADECERRETDAVQGSAMLQVHISFNHAIWHSTSWYSYLIRFDRGVPHLHMLPRLLGNLLSGR